MSMGFMVAASSRKRDDRGRYMEGDDRRMGNDHSTHYGNSQGNYAMDAPEMRRRRDSRGRYMEGEDPRMAYEGSQSAWRPWPEPHIPPYLDQPEGNDRPGRERRDDGRMEHEPYMMRDRNVVNIRDYQDKRRIGFGANEEEGAEMRHYGRRFDPDRMHMGKSQHREMEHGYAAETDDGKLTREEAEKWVAGMKSDDGRTGARWPLHEIKQYAGNFGVQGDEVVEFFAVMNALASDFGKVAKKHGVDKVDFWADLAKAFMHDKDAVPDKVKIYYECIAKHDDD